jgi:hypothetical protein
MDTVSIGWRRAAAASVRAGEGERRGVGVIDGLSGFGALSFGSGFCFAFLFGSGLFGE